MPPGPPPLNSAYDMTFWITAGIILLLLMVSGFFSGSETALTAASRAKLRAQADKGARGARRALRLTEDSERLIGAVLLGNNLANILAASLATALFTRLFGDSGVALSTLVMTLMVLVFAEVLPKTYAIANPEAAAARVSPLISPVVLILSPIVNAIRAIVRLILRLFGMRTNPDSRVLALALREEIIGAISLGHSEGTVGKEDRDRLLGALDLNERRVDEIMLHRSKIEMIDAGHSPEQVLTQCLKSAHTRLPVYRDNAENIIGVIHAKDLLRAMLRLLIGPDASTEALHGFQIMGVAKEPYFVPETTTLNEQMRQFLLRKSHFALVVDEYGALQGLMTLEDILEEIVGEITDEFDTTGAAQFERANDGQIIVDGAMTIRDLNRAMDWNLPDDEANTIAGLVIHEAQLIPSEGQVFSFHNFRFEVLKRQANRIVRLKLRQIA